MPRISLLPVASAGLAILVLVSVPGQPASAQGFFETLFGLSKPRSQPRRLPRYAPPPRYTSPFLTPRLHAPGERPAARPRHSGRYRTVCVRMCDGYYWPVSSSVSRSRFSHDARTCRAKCGSQARLFYHGSHISDAKRLVDLTGRSYARLPTAFLYRKKYIKDCRCKPDPWAQSELNRHRGYALAAEGKAGLPPDSPNGDIEVIAGRHPSATDTTATATASDMHEIDWTGTRPSGQPNARPAIAAHPAGPSRRTRQVGREPRTIVHSAVARKARGRPKGRPRRKKTAFPVNFFGLNGSSRSKRLRWPGQ